MDHSRVARHLRILFRKLFHPVYLDLYDLFLDLLTFLRKFREIRFDLVVALRRGRLHHPSVFLRDQIASFRFRRLQIRVERCQQFFWPGQVLAAPHHGKGVPVVLTARTSAFVFGLVKLLPFCLDDSFRQLRFCFRAAILFRFYRLRLRFFLRRRFLCLPPDQSRDLGNIAVRKRFLFIIICDQSLPDHGIQDKGCHNIKGQRLIVRAVLHHAVASVRHIRNGFSDIPHFREQRQPRHTAPQQFQIRRILSVQIEYDLQHRPDRSGFIHSRRHIIGTPHGP